MIQRSSRSEVSKSSHAHLKGDLQLIGTHTLQIISSPAMEMRLANSSMASQVNSLIEDLNSTSIDAQREAAAQLRLLSKNSAENRKVIGSSGAVTPLINLLHSTDVKLQEHAVTAILNLSIDDKNKTIIASAEAFEPLIHVLETGSTESRENAAATFYSLSKISENRIKIGGTEAIAHLVEILENGSSLGRKDALAALVNLSSCRENKGQIVKAGAVKLLIELADPAAGVSDVAIAALLANLATNQEGRVKIGEAGVVRALVEIVEMGSEKGKEFAAAGLSHLCLNSNKFCNMLLKEDGIPPLMALLRSRTPRAKEKASQILRHLRIYQKKDAY